MTEQNFTLYLDESGDDLLYTPDKYNQNPNLETHCTLLGFIIPHDKKTILKDELEKIKISIWKSNNIVLHSVDIRHKKGSFALFHYNPEIYETFKSEMNKLTNTIRPMIVCSSIDKKELVERYPKKLVFKDNPYDEAFTYLLERFAHFLNSQPSQKVQGEIVVEKRESMKNTNLRTIFTNVLTVGTNYHPSHFFKYIKPKIEFHAKGLNIPGLQMSDYFSYPFYINHKFPKRENNHYDFLKQFVYPGDFAKYGHKKWPI